MKIGFNFRWFAGENCGISVSVLEFNGCDYFEIFGVKILKFIASVHLKRY